MRVGTIAAIDTAMIAGAQDNLKQSIEVSAGAKSETDWGRTGKAAAIGGLFGFGLGGALGAGAAWIGQRATKMATKGGAKTPDTPETLSLKADAAEIHNEVETFSGSLNTYHGYDTPHVPLRELSPDELALIKEQHFQRLQEFDNNPYKAASEIPDDVARENAPFYIEKYFGPDPNYQKTFTENFDELRYGSVFGDKNTVYLDGDGKWINNSVERMYFNDAIEARVDFKNALVIRPNNFESLAARVRKDLKIPDNENVTGIQISEWAQSKGHDGLILDGMDHFSENFYKGKNPTDEGFKSFEEVFRVGEELTQDQVVSFNPKNITPGNKVPVGKDAPKGTVSEQLKKGSQREPIKQDAPTAGNKAFDDLVAAIKSVVPERLQDGTVAKLSAEEVANTVLNVSRVLRDMKLNDVTQLEGALRGIGMTDDQMSALKVAAQKAFEQSDGTSKQLAKAVQDAVGEDARNAAMKVWDDFEKLREQLGELDVNLSSRSGSDLGSRVGGKYVGENRGLGRDMILRDMGVNNPELATLEQKLAAQEKFNQLEARIQQAIDTDRRIQELTDEYYRLIEEGQPGAADKVFVEREALKEQVAKLQENASFGREMYGWFNKYIANPANEIAIANVFSTGTMIANIIPAFIKTAYKPILNAIIKGGLADTVALREASFFYSALNQSRAMAWNAAKAAFRYERSLISSDPARVIEHTPSIPGLTGRVIRTIPRMVAAADEFVKRSNYTAYVAHQAYGDALRVGIERGYKSTDLENFARAAAEDAVKNAFERAPAEDVSALIARDADLRGLTGVEREAYINERFAQDGELFARMKEGPAKDFSENMTFTRPFTGDNIPSSAAKGVEQFLQRNPIAKFAFQLFWRTPIRIYEEGIRLTPGINLIAPNFMADLRGVNGPAAQIKAQGEAMLSIAWSSSFFTMYGNGTYVGNGPSDPKLRQAWLAAGNTPNTIVFPGGKKLDVNRLEPFNIPFKLMAAAMDRTRELEYRRSQGEYVDKELREALAWAGVATGTAASIFHDANIAGGIEAYLKLVESLTDPEKSEQALQQFVADKARMAIPSIYTRAMQEFGSGLDLPQFTPYTLEQMIMTRINPASKEIPLKFDVIGNPITTSYSSEWEKALRLWGNIGVQTGDPHFDKLTPQQQYVLTQTQKLGYAIGESFQMPFKVKAFGDFDLRSTKTVDGKEFYYNRIQRYAVELGMHDALEQAYRQMEGVSKGRKSIDGIQPSIIKNIFSQYRNAAIMRVIQEESGLRQRFIQQKLEQFRTQQGNYDVLSQPY